MTVHELIKKALENGYDNYANYQRVNFFDNNILEEEFSFDGTVSSFSNGYPGKVRFKDNYLGKKNISITYLVLLPFTVYESSGLSKLFKGKKISGKIGINSFELKGKFCMIEAKINRNPALEKMIRDGIKKTRKNRWYNTLVKEKEKLQERQTAEQERHAIAQEKMTEEQEDIRKEGESFKQTEQKELKIQIAIGLIGALCFLIFMLLIPNPYHREFPTEVYFIGSAIFGFAGFAITRSRHRGGW